MRTLQENKTRVWWPQILQKHELVLGLCFRALPRYSGYIGVNLYYLDYLLNLGYLLKLAIITCLYTSLENILTM